VDGGARTSYNMVMVLIRPQADDDIDQVAALQVRTWQVAYAGLMPADVLAALDSVVLAAQRREYADHPDFRTLVADDGGVICGFAAFGPHRRGQGWDDLDRRVGELYALYVEPGRWGGGLGRTLLAAVEADLATRSMTGLRLWVLATNLPARRFYERSGLTSDGERDTIRLTGAGGAITDLAVIRYSRPGPDRDQDQ
jgi:ribosomal protein S18 acetylase RimI-like enzyme